MTVLLYVFGTQAGVLARTLFISPLVAMAVCAVFALWIHWRQAPRSYWNPFLISCALFYAVLCRAESVLLLSPFALVPLYYALIKKERSYLRLGLFAFLGLAAGGAADLLYKKWVYGDPFTTGYLSNELVSFTAHPLTGFARLVFSPSRGLFVLSPFLLFSFLGVKDFYRTDRAMFIAFLLVVLLYLGFFSFQIYGYEGSWGIRFLSPIIPGLMIMTGFGLRRTFMNSSPLLRRILFFAVAWSLLSNIPALFIDVGGIAVGWSTVNSFWAPLVAVCSLYVRGGDVFLLEGINEYPGRVIGVLFLSFVSGTLSFSLLKKGFKHS